MLQAEDLWKIYAGEGGVVEAVKGVSLEIRAGQFAAVIGRSGSGKSSLMGMLGGLSRPSRGTVRIDGTDIWALSDDQRAHFRNRRIGFVFQFPSLLPTLRAVDNVALPAVIGKHRGLAGAYRRAEDLLVQVGLVRRLNAYPSELSGGEQRRTAIARALINAPDLILADEPTGDLDEDTEAEMMGLLQSLCRCDAATLIIVTHSLVLAERSDRVITLRQGTLSG